MLKIVFVYLGQQGGGTALDACELAEGLSQYADVLCVVSSKSASYKQWLMAAQSNSNLKVMGVKTTKKYLFGFLSFLNVTKFWKINRQIQKFCPDVVYSHMAHPWECMIIPSIKCKLKLKGVHDVKLHQGEDSLFQRLKNRLFSYKSNSFVVFSDFSRKELVNQGVNKENIVTISLGCTKLLVKNRRIDLDCHKKVLFFGRLIKYKGLEVLFKSMEVVRREHPDVKFVIAGRGEISDYSHYLSEYEDMIELHNEWVLDEDIERYCSEVDFVVAPYIESTQSGVVVMAYSFGKPVIVSNCGGLPEQVVVGKTGIITPVGDSQVLGDKINELYNHEDMLGEMKKNAYEYSIKHDWAYVANNLYSQIESKLSV